MRTKSRAHSEGSTNSSSHKGDTMKPAAKTDVYAVITDRIIAQLEAGTVPWRKTWTAKAQMPKNLISGKTYRGINIFLLGCQNYESPFWLTYKQAIDKGGKVRKGEKGSPCVFWSLVDVQDKETDTTKKLPFLRYYTVFNSSQIEGLGEIQTPAETEENSIPQEIIDNMQNAPVIKHGFTKACYIPSLDEVRMPDPSKFVGMPEYFSVAFHELTHSTLHATRCNRKQTGTIQHGDENYAREELVAEMGAAFLCAETGISAPVIENQASYIASWLKALNNDKKLIVNAAGAAQRAVDYILNRTFNESAPEAI